MKYIQFLIKPASSACNLRCRYCFYADIAQNRSISNMGLMKQETVDILLQEAFANIAPGGSIHFAFQGGEPAIAGLAFYETFTQKVDQQKPADVTVTYSIQTNGTLLEETWIPLLKKYDFLVGVSLDGYKDLHNYYRVDVQERNTWKTVSQTFQMLTSAGIRTNALCVVTGQCAKHPDKAYRELKKLGAKFMQFIPCIDPIEETRGKMPFSLTPKAYGQFLCRLFDLWFEDWSDGNYHSIRLFDDYINILLGSSNNVTCATCGRCGAYFVVEGDGSVYPCDFFVLDSWKMGTLGQTSLLEMADGQQARDFLQWGSEKPTACQSCRWFRICNGGCKNDWERSGEPENHYCAALKTFFAHAEQRMLLIAREELRARKLYGNRNLP